MVSRFPNGSPITSDGSAQVLAEFNRDVTKADLIDKVDLIFYDGTDVFAMKSLATAQVESENKLVVKDPGSNANLDLTIEGNKLVTSENYGFFFDIDFDEQHRKFFEQASATYLMQLPNIIEQVTPERYAVVRVTNALETSGALSVAILINTNNEPWSGDAELSDIDVAAFFDDNIDLSSVQQIVKEVLKMEYYIPSSVQFNVVSTPEQSVSVDGGLWNLFTDGSVYVPLVMTSRFPNGAPIRQADIQESHEIEVARFNRAPAYYQLAGLLRVVAQFEGNQPDTAALSVDGEDAYFIGPWGSLFVKVDGNSIKVTNIGDIANVWDIDFDNQHQRTLNITDPSGNEDWANLTINNPEMINDTPYQFMLAMNIVQNIKSVVVPVNQSGEIKVFNPTNNTVTYRQSEMQTAALVQLVGKIVEMEFGSSVDVSSQNINDDLPIDTFNLLTDSDVILPS